MTGEPNAQLLQGCLRLLKFVLRHGDGGASPSYGVKSLSKITAELTVGQVPIGNKSLISSLFEGELSAMVISAIARARVVRPDRAMERRWFEVNSDGFWALVDRVHEESGGDMDEKCELLKAELSKLPAAEVHAFCENFGFFSVKAYTWDLWAAAYIIGGGCSDDSFSDFRASLISMGKATFSKVTESPESLADLSLDEGDMFYEGYQYVGPEVHEKMTGNQPETKIKLPDDPAGEEWDEDSVEQKYPRLAEKFAD